MAVKDPSTGMMRILTFEETLDQIRTDKMLSQRPSDLPGKRMNLMWYMSPFNQRLYNEVAEDLNRDRLVKAENERAQQSFNEFAADVGVPVEVAASVDVDMTGDLPPPAAPIPPAGSAASNSFQAPVSTSTGGNLSPGIRASIGKKRQTSSAHIPQTEREASIREQADMRRDAMDISEENAKQEQVASIRKELEKKTTALFDLPPVISRVLKLRRKQKIKSRASKVQEPQPEPPPQFDADKITRAESLRARTIMEKSRRTQPDRLNEMDSKRTMDDVMQEMSQSLLRRQDVPTPPQRRRPRTGR